MSHYDVTPLLEQEGFTELQLMPYGYGVDYKAKRSGKECFVDAKVRGPDTKTQFFRFKAPKLKKLAAANSILPVYLLFVTKWGHHLYTFDDLIAQKIDNTKITVRDKELIQMRVPLRVIAPLRPFRKDCEDITDPRMLRHGEGPRVDIDIRIAAPRCVDEEFRAFIANNDFPNRWTALLYLVRNVKEPYRPSSKKTVTTVIR